MVGEFAVVLRVVVKAVVALAEVRWRRWCLRVVGEVVRMRRRRSEIDGMGNLWEVRSQKMKNEEIYT